LKREKKAAAAAAKLEQEADIPAAVTA